MDLALQIKPRSEDMLLASYVCPCGCNPRLAYQRGAEHAVDGCCCGNQFVVGPRAADHIHAPESFGREVQSFEAPWGEALQAAWAIGPSTDPNAAPEDSHGHGHEHGNGHGDGHEHGHAHGHDEGAGGGQQAGSAKDPVCGMTVDIMAATERGLSAEHEGATYYFCGRGCKLEFGDDPKKYLDPSYVPSM
jgi:YHS domain-containing protein